MWVGMYTCVHANMHVSVWVQSDLFTTVFVAEPLGEASYLDASPTICLYVYIYLYP